MPSKNSPSKRAKSNRKTRPLSRRIVLTAVPKGTSKEKIKAALTEAVITGQLPDGWEAQLFWGNRGRADRSDELLQALAESSEGGREGFDTAILDYIERL